MQIEFIVCFIGLILTIYFNFGLFGLIVAISVYKAHLLFSKKFKTNFKLLLEQMVYN